MIAVRAKEGVISIEDDKPEAITAVKGEMHKYDNIRIEILPKKYPQGYEKMIITMGTGKEVPSGGLPHDVGVSVHNVGTAFAIYEADRQFEVVVQPPGGSGPA